ncbi:MAG TPA: CehA/McbA family metallohydrolase [Kofleriaceae bacterium]|jgi:hypothetical protein
MRSWVWVLALGACQARDRPATEDAPERSVPAVEVSPPASTGSSEPATPSVRVSFGSDATLSDTPLGMLPHLTPMGGLSFEILDAATGKRMPGKLTLSGVGKTKEPRFSKDIGVENEAGLEAYNRVFSVSGVGVVALPFGTYQVTFSRGPEWTIDSQRVTIRASGVELHAKLAHVVDTPGWISGDFHVHAASSPDSRVPMRDRVYEFIADGVDLIVATDHNVVSDYKPIIADMHVEHLLASSTGDEITTADWGHFGAFPLPVETAASGHGAIPVADLTPTDIFASVRKTAPAAVIDIHHPRLEKAIGYFYLGKFDDARDEAKRPGFSYDFDAIEVLNGYQDTNRRTIDRVMQDWFALLDRGHLVTATGNSDTHHLDYNIGGYPRNYVRVADDDVSKLDPSTVAAAVKAHHSFFTTGPIVDVSVGGVGMGDLAPAPGGKATLDIRVRAAPWVSVSRVIIYVAGKPVHRYELPKLPTKGPLAAMSPIERFHQSWAFSVPHDTYVVVRVEGDSSLSPVVGGGKDVTVFPFAITNPIFLDVDGNGAYDPPLPHGAHEAKP